MQRQWRVKAEQDAARESQRKKELRFRVQIEERQKMIEIEKRQRELDHKLMQERLDIIREVQLEKQQSMMKLATQQNSPTSTSRFYFEKRMEEELKR